MDMEYLNMIKQNLNTPYYYFSYTYDLTNTMQRQYDTFAQFVNVSLFYNQLTYAIENK